MEDSRRPVFDNSFVDANTGKINIHALDRAIELYKLEIARLRRLKNTRSAAHNLPAELLSRVFGLCLPLDWQDPRADYLRLSQFVKLTHVCSRWHSIAVGDPNLWSVVPAPTVDQTRVLLERARGAPLTVTLPDREDDIKKLVKAAIQRGALVRSLLIRCQTYPDYNDPRQTAAELDLLSCLQQPAPELEHLVIASYNGFEVPANLFDGTAPKLRHLHFSRAVFLPHHWPFVSGLRSLHLESTGGCSEMALFLAVQTMNGLERLTLKYKVVPSHLRHELADRKTPPSVQLPYLTHIVVISDEPSTVELFMTYLVLPRLLSLEVQSSWDGLSASPVVRAFFNSNIRHVRLARLDMVEGRFEIPQSQDSSVALKVDMYGLTNSSWLRNPGLPPSVEAFMTLVGCCTLEILSVRTRTHSDSLGGAAQSWIRALGSGVACCTLREVDIESSESAGLLEALGHAQLISSPCICESAASERDTEARSMLPFLHHLETVAFTGSHSGERPSRQELLGFERSRVARARAGLPLLVSRGLDARQ